MKLDRRVFLGGSSAMVALLPLARSAWGQTAPVARHTVRGASGPIEIVEDSQGIPHIRAATKPDAFFGQGYVVARDRLFQLDLSHRRSMGRMAEAFGPDFAIHDHGERLFHFRGDLEAELAVVPREILDCARGYVAGINARIDEVIADRTLLPPEYRILGALPLRWDVRDLVLARGASIGNVDDEIRRARLAAMGMLELDTLVAPLRPAWELRVPEGLDVAEVSEADLGVLAQAEGALPFGATPTPVRDPAGVRIERENAGSNAWTIAPGRSATGRPILANDPHLGIGGFAPRHVAHLTAPGLDVIGGGAPGLAGIMQGHTDRFAFGRTNSHNDQSDLFILELDPADPERYRHDGGWKRFVQVREVIAAKGAPARTVVLRYCVHGPVLLHDPARGRATSLASVTMMPGAMGAFAMIAINLGRHWAGLKEAFKLHPSPTNFHYADIDGNHGWQVIGHAPIRGGGHDGLLPVPGDGRYDWQGRFGAEKLPSEYNPAKGWFATANQNNLPADYPVPLAFSFREPYRYERIKQVLTGQPKHSITDSAALQQDVLSTPARELVALIPARVSAAAMPAAAMLRGWDGQLGAGSAAGALFQILWAGLGKRVLDVVVPVEARELVPSIAAGELIRLFRARGPDMAKLFDEALVAAWDEAKRLMGDDPAAWRWGSLHQVRIAHPLARLPAIAAAFPTIEGGQSPGDNYTVNARWVAANRGYRTSGGASYLQVIDVGDWDNSLYLNLPGQSADPRSPHYPDHYAPWITGRMRKLPFSRGAVDADARGRTMLVPEGGE
ncbi:penicillin acylase family protein [Sphingomonas qomolangmaensis]|uniref:Penicillin acylase family protein n=1 Tax=Sphingomonas qomolangmaensis TaxID=2918765 RepID=A0ABY5LAP8_9SPHN|nr:penicillin acylase family protein [Sphingomonas qomolangmaensis]UUL82952.1 penicillin acylase family protein [Sphingomonas qomolangmaensis]